MYFVYRYALDFRDDPERGYRIGYAHSDDLFSWTRDDANAGITYSNEGWDSKMAHYPHVFELDGKWFMYYNGNDLGIRTLDELLTHTPLAGERLQPLGHKGLLSRDPI